MVRKAKVQNKQGIQVARGVSIPAPTNGWDAITSQAAMPEDHAITLKNMFPQPGYIEVRGGAKRHIPCTATLVETILPYHGMSANTLFAASQDKIFNVTVTATATASTAVSGLSSARWQYVNFSGTGGHFLWIANGADTPRNFNGTAWATCSIVGVTPASIIQPAVYKNRIWLVIDQQISPYYLNVNAIEGSATQFNLAGVFELGGALQAIGTWNFGGDGPDNFIAFASNRGEVAIYSGVDPTDSNSFVIRGVYPLGEPLGRRCFCKVANDLAYIGIDGVVPLSRAIVTERGASTNIAFTKNIQPVMNSSARSYRTNNGWQLTSYPRGQRAILNVPVGNGTLQEQYVMNVVTGAWCRFTGMPANCWGVWNDRLFFGGNNGYVYEADCQGFDDDGAIDFDMELAFNYCGARGQQKQWTLCRPIIATDGQVTPGIGISVDFDRSSDFSVPAVVTTTQALWDSGVWDVSTWGDTRAMRTDWTGVSGYGTCASIRLKGTVQAQSGQASQSLLLQVFGFDLQLIDGALIP